MLTLNTISPSRGSRKRAKRIGRGNASGHGTYSTRGIKGQRARSGGRRGLKRLGMKRIIASLPKRRGFVSHAVRPVAVPIALLAEALPSGGLLKLSFLKEKGLIPKDTARVKLIGAAPLRAAYVIRGLLASKGARAAIEQAGGRFEP